MSGEAVERLKRRARAFLEAARLTGDSDLKAFFAEQAMQLYSKAVLLELFGEETRIHAIREILGLLARRLAAAGYREEAARLMEYVARERLLLLQAEEAYITARYGIGYTGEEAEALLGAAARLIELLEEVARNVKLGEA